MNTMGSLAGAFSVTLVGYILTWTGDNWTLTFLISSSIYLVGAVCWLFLDAHTPIERQTERDGGLVRPFLRPLEPA